jgi:hypothetical protein
MFERFFGKKVEERAPDEEAAELTQRLLTTMAFQTNDERAQLKAGQKLEVTPELQEVFDRANELLASDGLSERARADLALEVKEIVEEFDLKKA